MIKEEDVETVQETNIVKNEENSIDVKPEWTNEDMIGLIQAVKFKNKEASMRDVHNEITTKMASIESYEFLSNVKLNDVKKVWKKALSGGRKSPTAQAESNILPKNSSVLKLYTVGDGSVQSLAESYTMKAAAEVAAEKATEKEQYLKGMVHCFLDVPADKSGTKPHQALINFNDNRKGSKKKGGKKKNKSKTVETSDGREIVKIQLAASIPGHENIDTPMLLYNANRTARTFIHPDEDDDGGSYNTLKGIIMNNGTRGALTDGGTKAYFYCQFTKRPQGEKDIVSIDVTETAPTQPW